jgi:hypothetical protein
MEFEPVGPDYDFDSDVWLEKTSYTVKEKESLRKLKEEKPNMDHKDYLCKCFCKAETYIANKHARPIKSTSDRFKIAVGPAFQAINEQLFCHCCFVKKIPVFERPQYIKDLVDFIGYAVDCTDFSTFEAHFISSIMHCVEFVFYSFVLHLCSCHDSFMGLIKKVLSGRRTFIFKYFTTMFQATRASGEMCTSSGNGFSNYMIYTYLARVKGAFYAKGGHEGDDGITCTKPDSARPTTSDYQLLGWTCKLEAAESFSEASFCGIVSDREDLVNVTDILKAVAEFGWTSEKYAFANELTLKALLRAKGYSMIYQYPGCPVLDALGHYALRVTDDLAVKTRLLQIMQTKFEDSYKRNLILQAIEFVSMKRPDRKESPPNTRRLVYKKFGVSEQKQLEIESYLDSLSVICPLQIDLDWHPDWVAAYDQYVRPLYDRFWSPGDPFGVARRSLVQIQTETGVSLSPWVLQIG